MLTTDLLRVEVAMYPKGHTISGKKVSDFVVDPGNLKRYVMWTVHPDNAILYTNDGIFFKEETMSLWITPVGEAADGIFTGDMDFTLTHGGVENILGRHKETFAKVALEEVGDIRDEQWNLAMLVLIRLNTETMDTEIVGKVTMEEITRYADLDNG
jgi:hypothetical protein